MSLAYLDDKTKRKMEESADEVLMRIWKYDTTGIIPSKKVKRKARRRMAELLANNDETIIHVCDPSGSGEYTFCGLEMQEGSIAPAYSNGDPKYGLHKVTGRLPNCIECKECIRVLRKAMRGVRFSNRMVSLYDVREV